MFQQDSPAFKLAQALGFVRKYRPVPAPVNSGYAWAGRVVSILPLK